MSFTIANLKDAFSPRNIKSRMPKNPNYIDDTLKKFFNSNPELVGSTLTQITNPTNAGMKARFMAIENVINNKENALDELSGLVGATLMVGSTEPAMSESKKLSGRKIKGKAIEKGSGVVKKMDFGKKEIEVEPDGGMKTPPMEELEEEKEAEKPTSKLRGSMSKPAEKPKPPEDTYPAKEQKKPKVEASTPKPPTVDTTPEKEMSDIEKAAVKTGKAKQKFKETIESIAPDPPNMAESVPEPEPVPQPIKLTTNKKKDSKVVETEVKTGLEDIPSKIDLIPPERLSSEFKSATELESDINYFFKTFPKQLENIKKTYSKAKKTPQYLKRTHKRIVAILRAGAKESKEKVGVIIEGSEFIKDKLREIYLEEINKGLTAEDLIMNVEKETAKDKSDIGFYEIKKGPSGKEHSQREPIYSKIPQGDEFDPKKEFSQKPARLNTLPTEYRSRFTYENTLYENNPFTKPQSRIQLRKLY